MIVAKKKFGQNFLQDASIKEQIIQSMSKSKRKLVEIGPGLGDLTQKLLEVKPLIAYEIDSDLCVYLKEKFAKECEVTKRLLIKQGDVLEQFQKGSLCEEEYDIVANLPYYVATTIILEALKDPLCKSLTVMIQKEVAQKFCAACKSKEFSSLAILTGIVAKAKILFDVPPEAFDPIPKVISSVLKIEKNNEYVTSNDFTGVFSSIKEFEAFQKYLRVAFSAPRKRWIKNISSFYNKQRALALLEKLEYKETIRPHEISVLNHHLLFKNLWEKNDGKRTTTATTSS
jgi:16S rRNA (adenine1518-N6/adenine1519-N6)-dimethyltransferase